MAIARTRDLLQLLANPTNRTILSVLSLEPQYPRRLAEIVGLTEDEASRRLRLFEKAGLAEGSWANVGKNVRLYRLATSQFTVKVEAGGLTVAGVRGEKALAIGHAAELPPAQPRFVGRRQEIEQVRRLLESRRSVCVNGIGGSGKTALAAALSRDAARPVLWHTVAPGETGALLLGRLAANQRALETGERAQRLLAVREAEDPQILLQALVESVNATRALVVLDRFEAAGEGSPEIVAEIARGLTEGRLLLTARAFPQRLPRDVVASVRLAGLAADEARELLAALGAPSPADAFSEIYDRTHGHPLSLVLIAQVAEERREASVGRLLQESGIRDFLLNDVLPQLSEAERNLLLALSTLREAATAEEAEAIAAAKHGAHTLLRLESRGLVSRAGDTVLVHDLVRSFAAEAVPNRKQVHQRAAKVLRGSGEPAKVIEAIHHALEAGVVPDAAAIVREEVTRRTYRFTDLGLEPRYLPVLERLLQQANLDGPGRAATEIELGRMETAVGEAEKARRHLAAAERDLPARDVPLQIAWLLAQARLHRVEGNQDEAAAAYERAEALAERSKEPALLLEALVDHAYLEEERSDEDALRLYLRAVEVGRTASDIRLVSLVCAGAARVSGRSNAKQGLEWAQEGLRLARLSGYLRGEAAVYATLTSLNIASGQIDAGIEDARRYVRISEVLRDPWLRACALVDLGFICARKEQWDEALKLAREAREIARRVHSPFYDSAATIVIARVHLAQGRRQEAIEEVRRALREDVASFPGIQAKLWETLADALEASGDRGEAKACRARAKSLSAQVAPGPLALYTVRPAAAPATGSRAAAPSVPRRKPGSARRGTP